MQNQQWNRIMYTNWEKNVKPTMENSKSPVTLAQNAESTMEQKNTIVVQNAETAMEQNNSNCVTECRTTHGT